MRRRPSYYNEFLHNSNTSLVNCSIHLVVKMPFDYLCRHKTLWYTVFSLYINGANIVIALHGTFPILYFGVLCQIVFVITVKRISQTLYEGQHQVLTCRKTLRIEKVLYVTLKLVGFICPIAIPAMTRNLISKGWLITFGSRLRYFMKILEMVLLRWEGVIELIWYQTNTSYYRPIRSFHTWLDHLLCNVVTLYMAEIRRKSERAKLN